MINQPDPPSSLPSDHQLELIAQSVPLTTDELSFAINHGKHHSLLNMGDEICFFR
jgi:hypothetical protein